MELFLDTPNIEEIQKWLAQGVIDGVTTNPTLLMKDGVSDVEGRAREILTLIAPRPLSVEVVTDDPSEMVTEGRRLAGWAENVVVKIPVITSVGRPCLDVVKALVADGIRVNVTACLTFGQVVLAAKAGATYASIFGGRVADEGRDAPGLVRDAVAWLKAWGYPTKIIVASIRDVINLQEAALAGGHVITVPPQFLAKWVDHQYGRATVRQFYEDGRKTQR